jgi:hypothetical protein
MITNRHFSQLHMRELLCIVGLTTLLLVLIPMFSVNAHAQSAVENIVYVATSADVSGYPNPEDPGSTSTPSIHIPWHVGPNCPACFITIHGSDIYTATSTIVTRSNAQTGKLESITRTSAPIVAAPVVEGNALYIATSQGIDGYPDPDGVVPTWHWPWPWPPCLVCGLTFNQGSIYARSDANEAVLDASSGRLLGAHTFTSPVVTDPIFNGAAPIIQTQSSVFAFSDPYFTGLDWEFDTPIVTCAACTLFFTPRSQSVVATVGKTFYTLNATSGKVIASTALPAEPILNSVSVGNTRQVATTQGTTFGSFTGVSADGDDDTFICGNGIIWHWPGGPPHYGGMGSAVSVITGSIIDYVGANTSLFAIDGATGKQLNVIQLRGSVQGVQVTAQNAG